MAYRFAERRSLPRPLPRLEPPADGLLGQARLGEMVSEQLWLRLRRYETRSTIMTSNRPLPDWGKLIGDVPAATAILDRFLHHAEIITMNGKSYRLRNKATPNAETKPDEDAGDPKAAISNTGSGGAATPAKRSKSNTPPQKAASPDMKS
jgi:IstB-like ATP binding protein